MLRALEKEPEQRYQQATALKTEVETIANSRASSSGDAAPMGRGRRRSLATTLGIVVGVAAVGGLFFLVRSPGYREPAPSRVQPLNQTAPARPEPVATVPTTPTREADPVANRLSVVAPDDFDAFESEPEILRVRIAQTQAALEFARQRVAQGVADAIEVDAQRYKLQKLEARLKGDRPAFAEAALAEARGVLTRTRNHFNAGHVPRSELAQAEFELQKLEARLNGDRVALAKVALAEAKGVLDLTRKLRDSGLTPQAEVEQAEFEVRVAELRLKQETNRRPEAAAQP